MLGCLVLLQANLQAPTLQLLPGVCMLCCRFVSQGDLFGVLIPTQTQLPKPISRPSVAAGTSALLQHYDVAYFQVLQVSPEVLEPLAVDPGDTELVLKGGSARILLPVGFKGYAVAAAAIAQQAAAAGRGSVGNASLQPQRLACQRHQNSSTTAAAGADADAGDCGCTQPAQQHQQQLLLPLLPLIGVHASAAYQPQAGFPAVPGPLTDNWRHVAHVIAPLLHPAAQVRHDL